MRWICVCLLALCAAHGAAPCPALADVPAGGDPLRLRPVDVRAAVGHDPVGRQVEILRAELRDDRVVRYRRVDAGLTPRAIGDALAPAVGLGGGDKCVLQLLEIDAVVAGDVVGGAGDAVGSV